jgi:hypothetical protein
MPIAVATGPRVCGRGLEVRAFSGRARRRVAERLAQSLSRSSESEVLSTRRLYPRHFRQDFVGRDLLHQQEQGGRVGFDRAAELSDEIVGDAIVAELGGERAARRTHAGPEDHAQEGVEE